MTRACAYEPCGRGFEPGHPRQRFCTPTCRANQHYVDNPEKGRQLQDGALRCVAEQPLREVRGQQEEGASADYLILAREQIGRTLLATGWFTADDLEPLGIPKRFRRSVHGSATGYFSGELGCMVEAGRRKSERPARKGGKNTVFRITAKGRRELPVLLKDMEGPVRDASKRLYGDQLAGVGGGFVAGSRSVSAATGHSPHSGETPAGVSSEQSVHSSPADASPSLAAHPGGTPQGDPGALTGSAGEPHPSCEPVPLFEEEERPRSAFTDPEMEAA